MRRLLVPVLAVLPLLAGCGPAGTTSGGSFSGAEKDVAQAVSDLSNDGQRRKPDDICNKLLTQQLRTKVAQGGQDCASEMKKAIEDADSFTMAVEDVKITGQTATARVKSTDRGKDVFRTLSLKRENGAWRIDAFG